MIEDHIQAEEVPHLITLTELELGGNVTFNCSVSKEIKFRHWYKQSLGKVVQTVGSGVYGQIEKIEPFNNQRFQIHEANGRWLLTITSVNKEDEAVYFCQSGREYLQTFINGFFLAVKDYSQQTAVYVEQTPDKAAVRWGDSVTLQCSLLSKNKGNRIECPGGRSVHWFRAGSGKSHPSIIYRNRNGTDDDLGRSCVYYFSKTLQNSSDTGTYYCAVVTCGEILFGKGTQLNTREEPDLVVLVLGGLLVCCVALIVFLFYINRKRASEHRKGMSSSHCPGCDKSTADQSNDLDRELHSVSYAALDFSRRNVKHGNKKRDHTDCVYGVVRAEHQSHQQLSLQAEQGL
ncbi:uncharacterized protein PAE49_014289 isoform 2-T2 [Odontesthes bonariensis]